MAEASGRAALFHEVGRPFELREFAIPEPAPGAAVLQITVANICGSDLHQWRGETPVPIVPMVLGHEATGRIHRLGEGVATDSAGRPVKPGDRVVYRHFYHCGHCRACLRGDYTSCIDKSPHRKVSSEVWPHFTGAYGEYLYLRPGHVMFKVPDELSDQMVAGANCALSQVINGLKKARLGFGERVVIQGAGGLGVYASGVAKDMGADRVIVIDGIAERLQLAREFGADEVIDIKEVPDSAARVQRVKDLTEGWGADVVVEVVGNPRVVPEGLAMLGNGGRYLGIGSIVPGQTVEIDTSLLILANKHYISSAYWEPENLLDAIDFMVRTQGRHPFNKILSHTFPFERIDEAFAKANTGEVTRAALVMAGGKA